MYICGYDFILKYFRINLIYSKIQKYSHNITI